MCLMVKATCSFAVTKDLLVRQLVGTLPSLLQWKRVAECMGKRLPSPSPHWVDCRSWKQLCKLRGRVGKTARTVALANPDVTGGGGVCCIRLCHKLHQHTYAGNSLVRTDHTSVEEGVVWCECPSPCCSSGLLFPTCSYNLTLLSPNPELLFL